MLKIEHRIRNGIKAKGLVVRDLQVARVSSLRLVFSIGFHSFHVFSGPYEDVGHQDHDAHVLDPSSAVNLSTYIQIAIIYHIFHNQGIRSSQQFLVLVSLCRHLRTSNIQQLDDTVWEHKNHRFGIQVKSACRKENFATILQLSNILQYTSLFLKQVIQFMIRQ